MIEFTEGGKRYRGYTSGRYFCEGIPIDAETFRRALYAKRAR